ncbi:MAG: RNA polymerase sigma factor SigJ [Pseudonocardiaceae bacterium]
MGVDALAAEFQRHRSHLLGVGYRLTGSWADAEDAVQESWLRLQRAEPDELRDLRGWLTTVVGRLCLGRLRSAAVKRERYVGSWLPEPVVTPVDGGGGPAEEVVRDEGVRMAALVVLERLTPEQRVAFVLHDAFEVPFAEIATLLGCSLVAARQHASRGRRSVADADPPPRAALAEQQRMLDTLTAALAAADLDALVRLLHPDAVVVGDGGGKERTARRPVVGARKVARFLLGLLQRYGPAQLTTARPVLVNGDLGILVPAWPGDAEFPTPVAGRVACFAVRDGRVAAIYDVVNPDKLTRVLT